MIGERVVPEISVAVLNINEIHTRRSDESSDEEICRFVITLQWRTELLEFSVVEGGNPITPVIKVTGNPKTWKRMANNIDINASTIIDGDSLDEVGERIYGMLLEVADGRRTEAERRHLEEFAINEIQHEELGGMKA